MILRRELPIVYRDGYSFSYSTPDPVLEMLHTIDRDASGAIKAQDSITNPNTRDRYIQSSLIEEAITSSQLEGAATTREKAKQLIRSGRRPVGRSERMILNNYRAMQLVASLKDEPLTPELVSTIHAKITDGTLDHVEPPYFRVPGDGVAVYDERDNRLLHLPPPAEQIRERMAALCEFANKPQLPGFLHPVIKAIILHFWLAYDHPFVDGNGRTARALFYWSMLADGFWLTEFLSISRIFRKAPAKYGRAFLYTETDENDMTYFILYHLSVVVRAIDDLHVFLAKKMKEIRETENLVKTSISLNHRQIAILSHALRHPDQRYTIESHRSSHRVSYQTARTDLLGLERKKLFSRVQSGNTFVFQAVYDLHQRLAARKAP
jgi:Fic family protein